MMGGADVTVVDLSLSRTYRSGHIPGAQFAVWARLEATVDTLVGAGPLVLISEDGQQATLAANDLRRNAATGRSVQVLAGGMQKWVAEGREVETGGETWADHPDDVWLTPFERGSDLERAMQDYLTWEVGLVEQIERDGTARFQGEVQTS